MIFDELGRSASLNLKQPVCPQEVRISRTSMTGTLTRISWIIEITYFLRALWCWLIASINNKKYRHSNGCYDWKDYTLSWGVSIRCADVRHVINQSRNMDYNQKAVLDVLTYITNEIKKKHQTDELHYRVINLENPGFGTITLWTRRNRIVRNKASIHLDSP